MKRRLLSLSILLFVFACNKDEDSSPQYDNLQDALNNNASFSQLIQENTPSAFYGLQYGGGTIFYISAASEICLVAGPSDINEENSQFTGAPWRLDMNVLGSLNLPEDIGTGMDNTNDIVALYHEGYYAARLCYDYSHAAYTDWFLPSQAELNKMYENLHLLGYGDFNNAACYWSSSGTKSNAWYQFFFNGNQVEFGTLGTFYVRPIRSISF